jgi:hypothetical protein
MGQLFIRQVLYELGEPRWHDADRGKFLIHPPELSGNPTSHLVASRRNEQRKLWIWTCEVFLFILESDFFTCHKILLHGASGFSFPPKESVLQNFIALKSTVCLPGLNLRTLDPIVSTLTISPPRWLMRRKLKYKNHKEWRGLRCLRLNYMYSYSLSCTNIKRKCKYYMLEVLWIWVDEHTSAELYCL